jgi:hypothetical protein
VEENKSEFWGRRIFAGFWVGSYRVEMGFRREERSAETCKRAGEVVP